ncbi:SLC17A5 [Branchiostoma lanceolatum]|uniref:Sialin n=1 Tax=Branchiostoma lanceolatum TaxID=7740 RepID=A0A8J9Z6G2_BRALA|nr:SLC17A5 [Branchiostoma lanceolatum]
MRQKQMDGTGSSGHRSEKFEEKVPVWTSARYLLAVLGSFGFFTAYAMRVNLSVAMVAMVNHTQKAALNGSEDCVPNVNTTGQDKPGEFGWDSGEQSIILGAFFYGYIVTQIPGGWLAGRYGGKLVYGLGILCTALFTLVTPVAARADKYLFIAVRVVQGLGEGVTFPAMHAMWKGWAPPIERSKLITITYSGAHLGTVFSLPISGLLCDRFGWPSVFYAFGALGCVWFVLWMLMVHNTPEEHPRISYVEREYIQGELRREGTTGKNSSIPWLTFATSAPVWAIVLSHFSNNWGFYTLLTDLPTYMKEILLFDLTQAGFLSAVPYLCICSPSPGRVPVSSALPVYLFPLYRQGSCQQCLTCVSVPPLQSGFLSAVPYLCICSPSPVRVPVSSALPVYLFPLSSQGSCQQCLTCVSVPPLQAGFLSAVPYLCICSPSPGRVPVSSALPVYLFPLSRQGSCQQCLTCVSVPPLQSGFLSAVPYLCICSPSPVRVPVSSALPVYLFPLSRQGSCQQCLTCVSVPPLQSGFLSAVPYLCICSPSPVRVPVSSALPVYLFPLSSQGSCQQCLTCVSVPPLQAGFLSAVPYLCICSPSPGRVPVSSALPVYLFPLSRQGSCQQCLTCVSVPPLQSGFLSAVPYLCIWLVIISGGQLADFLRENKFLSTTAVRKVFNCFGLVLPGIFMVATGYVDCSQQVLAIVFLTLSVAMGGLCMSGFNVNHLDIAPRYAGVLMGISNCAATIPGFAGPAVVGILTKHANTWITRKHQWQIVFYITAGINAFGTITYLLMGDGTVQPWAKNQTEGEKTIPKDEERERLVVNEEDADPRTYGFVAHDHNA